MAQSKESQEGGEIDFSNFVDEEKLLMQFGEIEIAQQMVAMCIPMTFDPPEGLIYQIKDTYLIKDFSVLERHAHSLKGRGKMLYLTKLYDVCFNLQKAAGEGQAEVIDKCYKDFEEYMPECYRLMCLYAKQDYNRYPKIGFKDANVNEIEEIQEEEEEGEGKYSKNKQYTLYPNIVRNKNVELAFDCKYKCNIF